MSEKYVQLNLFSVTGYDNSAKFNYYNDDTVGEIYTVEIPIGNDGNVRSATFTRFSNSTGSLSPGTPVDAGC